MEKRETCFLDRKSTRLNSSHMSISYAVFCLKKKKYISCLVVMRAEKGIPIDGYLSLDPLADPLHPLHKTRFKLLRIDQFFFFNDTATTEIYTLSLHDALPI